MNSYKMGRRVRLLNHHTGSSTFVDERWLQPVESQLVEATISSTVSAECQKFHSRPRQTKPHCYRQLFTVSPLFKFLGLVHFRPRRGGAGGGRGGGGGLLEDQKGLKRGRGLINISKSHSVVLTQRKSRF